jgi:antirestriction protein ArdC
LPTPTRLPNGTRIKSSTHAASIGLRGIEQRSLNDRLQRSDRANPFVGRVIDEFAFEFYSKPAPPRSATVQRIERAESFFAATGAKVVYGGSRACYVPSTDNVHMPCIDFFRDSESYYAVRGPRMRCMRGLCRACHGE